MSQTASDTSTWWGKPLKENGIYLLGQVVVRKTVTLAMTFESLVQVLTVPTFQKFRKCLIGEIITLYGGGKMGVPCKSTVMCWSWMALCYDDNHEGMMRFEKGGNVTDCQ